MPETQPPKELLALGFTNPFPVLSSAHDDYNRAGEAIVNRAAKIARRDGLTPGIALWRYLKALADNPHNPSNGLKADIANQLIHREKFVREQTAATIDTSDPLYTLLDWGYVNPYPVTSPYHEIYANSARNIVRTAGEISRYENTTLDKALAVYLRSLRRIPECNSGVKTQIAKSLSAGPSGQTPKKRKQKDSKRAQLSLKTKQRVKRIDKICRYCMQQPAETVDHILALINGGSNDMSNLVGCCESCNGRKSNLSVKEAGMVLHMPLRFFDY